jgi:hypothetical protein
VDSLAGVKIDHRLQAVGIDFKQAQQLERDL